ncbi:hypothetical protein D3C71_1871540 [compost metagenome]
MMAGAAPGAGVTVMRNVEGGDWLPSLDGKLGYWYSRVACTASCACAAPAAHNAANRKAERVCFFMATSLR